MNAYMAAIPLRTPAAIGALIKDRRRTLGLDQADLAVQIGVSRLWINQIERGKPGASLGLVLRALDALGIELSADGEQGVNRTQPESAAPVISADVNAIIARARRAESS